MDTISTVVDHLDRPGGRIAYDVRGSGPLVICAPGMGDLRSVYRQLAETLARAGYRVATADLRGHGDSDTTFTEHGDVATAGDLLALAEHLGGPAVLVGNSMAAGASLWAAAERPDLVGGLVLLGPFARDAEQPAWQARLQRTLIRAALLRPWGPAAWATAYRRFAQGPHAGKRPAGPVGRLPEGFEDHVAAIRASLRDPAHLRSLRSLVGQLTHRPVDERLGEVRAPALVVMGAQDPDYPDPAAELAYIERRLNESARSVETMLVPECGHYPQSQRADVVGPRVVEFLAGLPRRGDVWSGEARSGDPLSGEATSDA